MLPSDEETPSDGQPSYPGQLTQTGEPPGTVRDHRPHAQEKTKINCNGFLTFCRRVRML